MISWFSDFVGNSIQINLEVHLRFTSAALFDIYFDDFCDNSSGNLRKFSWNWLRQFCQFFFSAKCFLYFLRQIKLALLWKPMRFLGSCYGLFFGNFVKNSSKFGFGNLFENLKFLWDFHWQIIWEFLLEFLSIFFISFFLVIPPILFSRILLRLTLAMNSKISLRFGTKFGTFLGNLFNFLRSSFVDNFNGIPDKIHIDN